MPAVSRHAAEVTQSHRICDHVMRSRYAITLGDQMRRPLPSVADASAENAEIVATGRIVLTTVSPRIEAHMLPPHHRSVFLAVFFEVIDSHDAKYPGDTPADNALKLRPAAR